MNLITPAKHRPETLQYRAFWYLFQLYKLFIFWPFLGLSTCFFGLTTAISAVFANATQAGKSGVLWAKANALVVGVRVKVFGREHITPQQSYIVVANHQSIADIIVVYGYLEMDIRWVMKKELRKVPALGYICEKQDHIYIDRSDPKLALQSMNEAQPKFVNGTSLFFFPGRDAK